MAGNGFNDDIIGRTPDSGLIEKEISSQMVFDGKLLHVYKDIVELPNGNSASREYIKHQGAVCVVPVTDDGKIVAVRQFRYPIGRVTVEIPAGKLDRGETPLEGALRELNEETGAQSDNVRYIGGLYPSVAYTDELIHMYIAENLRFTAPHTDDDEFIDVVKIDIDEFVRMILDGEVLDSKTQAAVLKAAILLGKIKR